MEYVREFWNTLLTKGCKEREKCYNNDMITKLIHIDCDNIDQEQMKKAGQLIKAGELVAFPTETVYGLGADALNKEASRKIYAAKGRPSDNPLIVHIAEYDALRQIVAYLPEEAKKLSDAFWPGPLTMRFKKNDVVPAETTGGLDTVAVRMPNHRIALNFIREAGGYIAAPSANTSGRPSPTLAEHVYEDMNGRIPMIIDGGQVGIGIESTIVDLAEDEISILRPGFITKEMIEEVLNKPVAIDPAVNGASKDQKPKAPGMKYRHYAPRAELILVEGETKAFIYNKMCQLAADRVREGQICGIMVTKEHKEQFEELSKKLQDENSVYPPLEIMVLGSEEDEASVARELYKVLRAFDDSKVDVIYAESFDGSGVFEAVMNRLIRAAGHKVVKA